MRLLLDTHIVIWLVDDAPQLSDAARRLLLKAESLHVSSITLWEIAIKVALGKLRVDELALDAELDSIGVQTLPVTATHARCVRDLPPIHNDPFDRMLVAQAMSEPLHFLTHDAALQAYSGLVLAV